MNDAERRRRLKAIVKILANPDIPSRLRHELEDVQTTLQDCVAIQHRAVRTWHGEAGRAAQRRRRD